VGGDVAQADRLRPTCREKRQGDPDDALACALHRRNPQLATRNPRLSDEELHLSTFDEQQMVIRPRHHVNTAKHVTAVAGDRRGRSSSPDLAQPVSERLSDGVRRVLLDEMDARHADFGLGWPTPAEVE